jgi:hypothetical protein
MAFERTLTGTLCWRDERACVLIEGHFLVPLIDELPPPSVRIPAEDARSFDVFDAYPLIDWPPTVTYRFVRREPRA